MKLLSICALAVMAARPLPAEDKADWKTLALRSQEFLRKNQFADATRTGLEALRIAKHFDPGDVRLASNYHLLGTIYRDWGHCAEARTNFVHAIASWRRVANPNPHHPFNAIASLISVLCECDDFPAAEKAFHTYQADLVRYRSDEGNDAQLLAMKAILARGRKQYSKAEALLREAVALMEKTKAFAPAEVEVQRTSLGVVLDKQGRHQEALAVTLRAIDFLEKNAPTHPSLMAAYNNAACSLADLGRMQQSEAMFQRAMDAGASLYGEENRVTAKIMLNYARVLRENKETPAAEIWQKRGAEAYRTSLRRDNASIDVEVLRQTK
jgi:tetratricopeptide (TPR) repeat protein